MGERGGVKEKGIHWRYLVAARRRHLLISHWLELNHMLMLSYKGKGDWEM